MARPRKDQQSPLAKQRIKESFWTLLEENDFKKITVGMLCQQARCNRGTFYYHYESLDDLLNHIIEEELLQKGGLPLDLFILLGKGLEAICNTKLIYRAQRFGLAIQRAGQERIGVKVKVVVVDMWEALLCEENEGLTPEARIMVEYAISGLIGTVDYMYRSNMLNEESFSLLTSLILKKNVQFLVTRISEAQHISLERLTARIRMFIRLQQRSELQQSKKNGLATIEQTTKGNLSLPV